MEGYTRSSFQYQNDSFPIYRRGQGPGVIILHEIPGITPQVRRFADRVADDGFTVVLPELFGTAVRPLSLGYALSTAAHACIRREFHVLARHHSSPIVEPLRALCRQLHAELGGPGIGALGMCFTGNFALGMMVDPAVAAPVMSQPSLPFGISASHRRALHISDAELRVIQDRMARGDKVLGLRFSMIWPVPRHASSICDRRSVKASRRSRSTPPPAALMATRGLRIAC